MRKTRKATPPLAIDRGIRAVWSRHPRVHFIPQERDFAVKLARGTAALATVLGAP